MPFRKGKGLTAVVANSERGALLQEVRVHGTIHATRDCITAPHNQLTNEKTSALPGKKRSNNNVFPISVGGGS